MGQRAVHAKRQERLAKALSLGHESRTARRKAATTESQVRARKFAIDVARLMTDDKCEDVIILDLAGISGVCDFFVIGTGTSDRQMRAVADHVEESGKTRGEKPFSTAGLSGSSWMVIDYVDVVIHLFDGEARNFYELETLWGDAPRVDWK